MYLIDTNVISAAGPTRGGAYPELLAWMDRWSNALHLSTVTIAEITAGLEKARRAGALRKAKALEGWLDTVIHLYRDRILPLDIAVARLAGQLSDRALGAGHAPGFADIAIAATAARHGLTILTRNLRHFAPLGVPAWDPFAALPPHGQ